MSAENPQGYLHQPTDEERLQFKIIALQNAIGYQQGQIDFLRRCLGEIVDDIHSDEYAELFELMSAAILESEKNIQQYQAQIDTLNTQSEVIEADITPGEELPHWTD
jgi:hypothetical protein